MNQTVQDLAAVDVLDASGASLKLGSFWEDRPVILAMIRHFG